MVSGRYIDTVYSAISRYLTCLMVAAVIVVIALLTRHLPHRSRDEHHDEAATR